jgi:Rod binding domain-containing protein
MSDFALPTLGARDVNLLKPVAQPTADADPAKIRKTAQDFEASFLSVMFNQMFEGVSTAAPFGGGMGEQAFRSFLTDAMAKSMVQQGGIGMSDQIARELMKLQGAA